VWAKKSQLKKLEFIIFSWMLQMKNTNTNLIPSSFMTSFIPGFFSKRGYLGGPVFRGTNVWKVATFGRRLWKYACRLATSHCCPNGAAKRTVSSHAHKWNSSSIPNTWHGGDSSEILSVFFAKTNIQRNS